MVNDDGAQGIVAVHVTGRPHAPRVASSLELIQYAYSLVLVPYGQKIHPELVTSWLRDFEEERRNNHYFMPANGWVVMQQGSYLPEPDLVVVEVREVGSFIINLKGLAAPLKLLADLFDPQRRKRYRDETAHRMQMQALEERKVRAEVEMLERQNAYDAMSQFNEAVEHGVISLEDAESVRTAISKEVVWLASYFPNYSITSVQLVDERQSVDGSEAS